LASTEFCSASIYWMPTTYKPLCLLGNK
jgi:hypothetical protein